jgi:hypothetical protein
MFYYKNLNNLIENITSQHGGVNIKLLIFVLSSSSSTSFSESVSSDSRQNAEDFSHLLTFFHKTNNMTKIIYTTDYRYWQLNLPADRRDYAAVFLASATTTHTDDNRLENWLNMSLKLPPDAIKIYVNHNDCHLNESTLSEIMSKLWHRPNRGISGNNGNEVEIGFIYYISVCITSTGVVDYGRQSHGNNYIVNLFYYEPFRRHKSIRQQQQRENVWGILAKINLINANDKWIDMSCEKAFHSFPFISHKLNFHQYKLTVILFPSTMAYLRKDLAIFSKYLSMETSLKENFPSHIDGYFGEDVEVLRELQKVLNFTINLSPTSDMGFYGFKVRMTSDH